MALSTSKHWTSSARADCGAGFLASFSAAVNSDLAETSSVPLVAPTNVWAYFSSVTAHAPSVAIRTTRLGKLQEIARAGAMGGLLGHFAIPDIT